MKKLWIVLFFMVVATAAYADGVRKTVEQPSAQNPVLSPISIVLTGSPMKKVVMYSTKVCPYCHAAERLLKARGVDQIEKILVDEDPALREQMIQRTNLKTVPQIFIGDTHVGGYDRLSELDQSGELKKLLNQHN